MWRAVLVSAGLGYLAAKTRVPSWLLAGVADLPNAAHKGAIACVVAGLVVVYCGCILAPLAWVASREREQWGSLDPRTRGSFRASLRRRGSGGLGFLSAEQQERLEERAAAAAATSDDTGSKAVTAGRRGGGAA